ncbi:molybdenum cofactor biosynthesis protein MoaE [alpha proteobacterium U9-1i]|nr:molybdenum cofactor biosynthesis protein MoaE [alpha proteobacterium U9-1i]
MRVELTPQAFAPAEALHDFQARHQGAGALVSFTGFCRGVCADGAVSWLDLEHYPGFTEREITRIAESIANKHALLDLLVVHRVGRVRPGEAIVLVAALSIHRAASFAAIESLMDYLKTDAPFWKREMRPGGAVWIEPTEQDYLRRAAHEERGS